MATFKDQNRDLQELVRELMWLRKHNLAIKEGAPQQDLLLFSEAAIVLLTLERFLRILPSVEATSMDTLPNLLEKATSEKRKVLEIPAENRDEAIKQIKDVRNAILHGNFEQAAEGAKTDSVRAYFKTQFAAEIEALYQLTDNLVRQIDPNTGNRYTK